MDWLITSGNEQEISIFFKQIWIGRKQYKGEMLGLP
jgi:hypothetical protein